MHSHSSRKKHLLFFKYARKVLENFDILYYHLTTSLIFFLTCLLGNLKLISSISYLIVSEKMTINYANKNFFTKPEFSKIGIFSKFTIKNKFLPCIVASKLYSSIHKNTYQTYSKSLIKSFYTIFCMNLNLIYSFFWILYFFEDINETSKLSLVFIFT